MGQPKSIWGRELCQELTRWRRRTPLSLESTLPCLGQLGGAFTALRSGRQSAYAEDSERGLLLVIRLEPPAILGPPPGLLHRAGAHATLRPTGKAPSLLLGTLFTRAVKSTSRNLTFDVHTARPSILSASRRVKYPCSSPSLTDQQLRIPRTHHHSHVGRGSQRGLVR
jgi:hypothetical protein